MPEERDVPEELQELMIDYKIGLECRDQCIASVFKAKRAIYYAREAEKARIKFWGKVYELYPDTNGEGWVYNFIDQILRKETSNQE